MSECKCNGKGYTTRATAGNRFEKIPCEPCLKKERAEREEALHAKMTPEQIENFRGPLSVTLGPYAFIMPAEDIQKIRDKMQADIFRLDDQLKGRIS